MNRLIHRFASEDLAEEVLQSLHATQRPSNFSKRALTPAKVVPDAAQQHLPMAANAIQLTAALLALVLLTFIVGARLLFTRIEEIRRKRIHPQAASNSLQMAARLENVQAADNFRNLFEVPVLFYALAGIALATHQTPGWLVIGAWVFVALRVVHSRPCKTTATRMNASFAG